MHSFFLLPLTHLSNICNQQAYLLSCSDCTSCYKNTSSGEAVKYLKEQVEILFFLPIVGHIGHQLSCVSSNYVAESRQLVSLA